MTKHRVEDDPRRWPPDTTGRKHWKRKSTFAEINRRDVLIVRLYRKGHNAREIADALGIGLTIVTERIRALKISRGRRTRGRGPVTEPCPWRDEDISPEEREQELVPRGPRWRQSRVVGMAQMLNDEYRESNFANVLANQVTEAEESGDRDWLMEALATFNAAIEKLERARRVLTDDAYRVACRDTLEGVEQMRHRLPPLRAVRDY